MASRYTNHLSLPLPQDGDIIDAKDISDGFARIDAEFKAGVPIPEFGENGNWKIKGVDTGRPYLPKKGVDYYTEADKTAFANSAATAAVSQVNTEMQQLRTDAQTAVTQATAAKTAAQTAQQAATTANNTMQTTASNVNTQIADLSTVKAAAAQATTTANNAATTANTAKDAAQTAATAANTAAQNANTAAANASSVASGALATQTVNGLMAAADKKKLDGLSQTPTIARVTTTADGLMSFQDKVKLDGLSQTPTINPATQTSAGTMSATDKTKLDGIEAGANKTILSTSMTETVTGKAADAVSIRVVNDLADDANARANSAFSTATAAQTTATAAQTTATAAQSKANTVETNVGDKNLLTTTDKSTLVSAVNELDGEIGNLSLLTTIAKNTIVDALNEVMASGGDPFTGIERRGWDWNNLPAGVSFNNSGANKPFGANSANAMVATFATPTMKLQLAVAVSPTNSVYGFYLRSYFSAVGWTGWKTIT